MGSSGASSGGGGTVTQISRQVLAAPAATISFASIAGTYENLIVSITGALSDVATARAVGVQFNGDTAAHYTSIQVYNSSATVASVSEVLSATSGNVGTLPASSAAAGSPGYVRFVVPGYARTVFNKCWRSHNFEANATGTTGTNLVLVPGGQWFSTAAITSILLLDQSGGNFITGTVATLYGES